MIVNNSQERERTTFLIVMLAIVILTVSALGGVAINTLREKMSEATGMPSTNRRVR